MPGGWARNDQGEKKKENGKTIELLDDEVDRKDMASFLPSVSLHSGGGVCGLVLR